MSIRHTRHRRSRAGAVSSWRASSFIAGAHGVRTGQAWPRFRASSAMTPRHRRHRRQRPAVRSSSSSASRTVRGSASALADGCGLVMVVNRITARQIMTRLRFDVPEFGLNCRRKAEPHFPKPLVNRWRAILVRSATASDAAPDRACGQACDGRAAGSEAAVNGRSGTGGGRRERGSLDAARAPA